MVSGLLERKQGDREKRGASSIFLIFLADSQVVQRIKNSVQPVVPPIQAFPNLKKPVPLSILLQHDLDAFSDSMFSYPQKYPPL